MKNYLLIIIVTIITFMSIKVNAQTEIKIFGGLDAYYLADNASIQHNTNRLFAIKNLYKDEFSLNNVILGTSAKSNSWRANLALDMQEGSTDGFCVILSQANLAFAPLKNKKFWVEGGFFGHEMLNVPGEFRYYSWNNYFTSYSIANSLHDIPIGELGFGVAYEFTPNTRLNVRVINSGYFRNAFDNNKSKSLSARLDVIDIFPKWNLSIGTLCGNENYLNMQEGLKTLSAVNLNGNFTKDFESMFIVQVNSYKSDFNDNNANTDFVYSAIAQIRYRLTDKMNTSARVAFSSRDLDNKDANISGLDVGINLEYRPTKFSFMRIEGGYLSINGKNDTFTKVFLCNEKPSNSRLHLAISGGVYFDIYSSLNDL